MNISGKENNSFIKLQCYGWWESDSNAVFFFKFYLKKNYNSLYKVKFKYI